ncbi:unnamed protein product [Heterobilharzia americana]|nr:unnamed protein product [Heterobilharzia americana]
MADNDSTAQMAITLQLPTFWAHRPSAWFSHVEAQFALRHIQSQETKSNLVIVSLPENVIEDVSDVLDDPAPNLYDRLKTALIKRVALTDQQKVQELFRDVHLGDRKPTQLLRQMKQLIADFNIDEAFLKQLWLQRLPQSVQGILAPFHKCPLIELAEAADRAVDATKPNTSISAALSTATDSSKNPHPPSAVEPTSFDVITHISKLYEELCSIRNEMRSGSSYKGRTSRSRNRSASRTGSRRSKSRQSQPRLCWYHKRYGANAKKCTRPCTFEANQAGNV